MIFLLIVISLFGDSIGEHIKQFINDNWFLSTILNILRLKSALDELNQPLWMFLLPSGVATFIGILLIVSDLSIHTF
jgi:hypothetical protein